MSARGLVSIRWKKRKNGEAVKGWALLITSSIQYGFCKAESFLPWPESADFNGTLQTRKHITWCNFWSPWKEPLKNKVCLLNGNSAALSNEPWNRAAAAPLSSPLARPSNNSSQEESGFTSTPPSCARHTACGAAHVLQQRRHCPTLASSTKDRGPIEPVWGTSCPLRRAAPNRRSD